jgi:hypothetical protein
MFDFDTDRQGREALWQTDINGLATFAIEIERDKCTLKDQLNFSSKLNELFSRIGNGKGLTQASPSSSWSVERNNLLLAFLGWAVLSEKSPKIIGVPKERRDESPYINKLSLSLNLYEIWLWFSHVAIVPIPEKYKII